RALGDDDGASEPGGDDVAEPDREQGRSAEVQRCAERHLALGMDPVHERRAPKDQGVPDHDQERPHGEQHEQEPRRRDRQEPLPPLARPRPEPHPPPRPPEPLEQQPGQPEAPARGPRDDDRREHVEQREDDQPDARGEGEPLERRHRGRGSAAAAGEDAGLADSGSASVDPAPASPEASPAPSPDPPPPVTEAGRTTKNVAPPPGRSSTHARPPCSSANRDTSDRPSPTPGTNSVSGPRRNGWKIASLRSSGTP